MTEPTAKPRPMTNAERSREWRRRRKDGMQVTRVEVFNSELDALVAAGVLASAERADPRSVSIAVERVVETAIVALADGALKV